MARSVTLDTFWYHNFIALFLGSPSLFVYLTYTQLRLKLMQEESGNDDRVL